MNKKKGFFERIIGRVKMSQAIINKGLIAMLCAAYTATISLMTAYAAPNVADSKIAKGTEKLIQDLTTWLMVLAPVIAGLLIIYFCIRRSAADDMDQKKWNNRIVAAIVSCVGAVLGSATLNLIIGYYQ